MKKLFLWVFVLFLLDQGPFCGPLTVPFWTFCDPMGFKARMRTCSVIFGNEIKFTSKIEEIMDG